MASGLNSRFTAATASHTAGWRDESLCMSVHDVSARDSRAVALVRAREDAAPSAGTSATERAGAPRKHNSTACATHAMRRGSRAASASAEPSSQDTIAPIRRKDAAPTRARRHAMRVTVWMLTCTCVTSTGTGESRARDPITPSRCGHLRDVRAPRSARCGWNACESACTAWVGVPTRQSALRHRLGALTVL